MGIRCDLWASWWPAEANKSSHKYLTLYYMYNVTIGYYWHLAFLTLDDWHNQLESSNRGQGIGRKTQWQIQVYHTWSNAHASILS